MRGRTRRQKKALEEILNADESHETEAVAATTPSSSSSPSSPTPAPSTPSKALIKHASVTGQDEPMSAEEVKKIVQRSIEAIRDELRCAVCLSNVSSPESLPCGHFFCKECMDQLFAHMDGQCPQCRKFYKRRQRIRDDVSVIVRVDIIQVFWSRM